MSSIRKSKKRGVRVTGSMGIKALQRLLEGKPGMYKALRKLEHRKNPVRNYKVPRSGSGIVKLVRKLVRLGRKRKNMKLTVRRVKR